MPTGRYRIVLSSLESRMDSLQAGTKSGIGVVAKSV